MPVERQVSFAGGELSPSLWGRTDLTRYPIGARTIKNFVVTPHGVLKNRPGVVEYFDPMPTRTGVTGIARVVPFIYSETDSKILLFRHREVVIYDGYSLSETYSRYQLQFIKRLSTAWSESQIADLQFSQVGNIMTITSPDTVTYKLERVDGVDANFRLSTLSFDVPEFPLQTDNYGADVLTVPNITTGGGVEVQFSDPNDRVSRQFIFLQKESSYSGDSSHPARRWDWQVTFVMRDSDGRLYETLPHDVIWKAESYYSGGSWQFRLSRLRDDRTAVYPDSPVMVWTSRSGGDASTGTSNTDTVVATRVYRGRGGRYGFIGETTGQILEDDGATPDFSNPPPAGVNPFKIYQDEVLLRTEYPSVNTFFQSRRYFASTSQRVATIWGSAVEQWENFDEVLPPDDSDSLEITLASNTNEQVRALIPKRQMLVMTSAAEWLITGTGNDEIVTPNSIYAGQISSHGSAALAPIAVGEVIFFLHRNGSIPRILVATQDGGYTSSDISLLSRHMFDGYTIVDWAYAETPYSILWVVRSDGKLLSLTHVPEQEMVAWAIHEVAGATIESVAVKPEHGHDSVFMVVKRGADYRLARMAWEHVTDVRHQVFLDRGVTYNGENGGWQIGYFNQSEGVDPMPTLTLSDPSANEGEIGLDARVVFSVTNVTGLGGRVIKIDNDDGEALQLLLHNESPNGTYDAQVLNVTVPDAMFTTHNTWYLCQAINEYLGDLRGMEGETVSVVADGELFENILIENGRLVIEENFYAGIIHVGIPYNCEFESLDAMQNKGKQKIIKEVFLELDYALGGEVGNELGDDMVEVKNRQVSSGYLPLSAQRIDERIIITDKWSARGRVAFRQSKPLAVTLLGIARDFKYGG
jgi:hypothetical protein